jgi:hypothetical protein
MRDRRAPGCLGVPRFESPEGAGVGESTMTAFAGAAVSFHRTVPRGVDSQEQSAHEQDWPREENAARLSTALVFMDESGPSIDR